MPLDSWEEAVGGGGRKQAPRHVLLSYLEATSVAVDQCWRGEGVGRMVLGSGRRQELVTTQGNQERGAGGRRREQQQKALKM